MAQPKIIEETNKLSGVTATQLGYISGLTSDAQTQINAKQATISATNTLSADLTADGSTNKVYTATEKTKLAGIAEGATAVTSSTVSGWGFKNNAASGSADGYMTSAQYTKLDGIATGATAVDSTTVSGWGYKNSAATASADGYMTSTQATKLDGVAEGATKVEVPSSTPATSTDAQYLTIGSTNYKFGGSASSVTCTLSASSWSSAAQTVSVTGMTASSVGTFGLATTATSAQYTAAAEAQLLVTGQAAGTITVTAYGTVPTVDIPCVVNIVG